MRVETACPAPDLQEDLLRNLLSLAGVADDPSGQAEHPSAEGVVQPFKGGLLPEGGQPQELLRAAELLGRRVRHSGQRPSRGSRLGLHRP